MADDIFETTTIDTVSLAAREREAWGTPQDASLADLSEAWGDPVDPLEFLSDDPGWYRPYQNYNQISDRQGGRNRPIFETEVELSAIRGAARLISEMPTAKCAIRNLTGFILGKGLAAKTAEKPGCPNGLAEAVQETIDEFYAANRWRPIKRKELYRRLHRDGEAFVGLFPQKLAPPQVRFVEPAQVQRPQAAPDIEVDGDPGDWDFGIHTRTTDIETVYGYNVRWTDSANDCTYFPADRVHHSKINVDSNVKRGLSDFYAVQQHLVNIGKLERNVAQGAAILSAIIGIRQHATGVTQSQAQSLVASRAYRQVTRPTPLGDRTSQVQRYLPGTWVDLPRGIEYKQSPLANQGIGEAFVTIEQALFRTVGSLWCMPEYMISGDASNANYASSLVAESPFVRFCAGEQEVFCDEETLLLWKVLEILAAAGRFRRWGVWDSGELRTLVAIILTGPLVEARNRGEYTVRLKTLNDDGIISDATRAAEEGYDLEEEQRRGAKPKLVSDPVASADGGLTSPIQPRATDETGHPLMKGATPAPASAKPSTPAVGSANDQAVVTDQDIQVSQDLVLNGAQIQAAITIVTAVATGALPRDTGIGQLRVLFNLKPEQAEQIMGSAGTSTPTTPNPRPADVATASPSNNTPEAVRNRLMKAAKLIWEGYP